MTLDALRAAHPGFEGEVRVLVHGGTCGHAVGVAPHGGFLRQSAGDACAEAACDGACWAAPAATVLRPGHSHRFARLDETGVEPLLTCLAGSCDARADDRGEREHRGGLMSRLGRTDGTLAGALAAGAYEAAARALAMAPAEVIDAVEAMELTGRGGAHFPTGQKWCFATGGEPPVLVVNAEEGEPGVFKDRHMLEGDPHRVIEGMLIAAHATGATDACVYINGQARRARAAFEHALAEAAEAGILGGDALGAAVALTIEVRSGAGGYVCGEETVILNSIEGQRPVPRFKPPQITEAGLFGRPTLLNNVETLAAATLLFDPPAAPPKLVPLSGAVARPGLYEVAVDGQATWGSLLEAARGGAHAPPGVGSLLVGGPSGVFVAAEQFDEPLEMAALGAGGLVALAPGGEANVTLELARYNARESCGECTPCREGTVRLVELLEAPSLDRPKLDELIDVITEASLCQLGGMAGRPIASALATFPQAFSNGAAGAAE
ncbi:MAG: NADH-ubiquinone oxidoreductase-F iron-sulfur binding region domain-containing protein [Dehalococcoidia bacterium]|nr:NADH-ubiquinone oxidoreductase-F iron-sulfur binding region domain-containing protein [Dehalococcoidia bacterium]